jgi:acyl-CoA thioester hydrolase
MNTKLNHISEFKVRDYECDLQGIVNNANYFHYLEQSRHEFLQSHGIDFKAAHDEGLDLVIAKAELDFIKSLKPSERFIIDLKLSLEGRLRYIFHQSIYRIKADAIFSQEVRVPLDLYRDDLILKAKISCVCVDRKRAKACKFPLLEQLLTEAPA